MAVSHVKSNTVADWTGTVTVGNSTGGTQTIAATDLVRPGDWNSAHNQYITITGNTAGTSTAVGTNVAIGGTNNITVSNSTAAGAATVWISGPSFSSLVAGTNVSLSSAGSTVTVNATGFVLSGSGNTAGTMNTYSSGTVVIAGGNNVTLSQSSNTISIVGGAGGGGAAVGISTAGNTQGTTGTYTSGTYVFEGSNSLSVSQITGTGVQTLRLIPAVSQLAGASGITLSSNGSTISIYPAIGYSFWRPFDEAVRVTHQIGQSSLAMFPVVVPGPVSWNHIKIPLVYVNTSNSSNSFTVSFDIGIYSLNGSTFSLLMSTASNTATSNSGTVGNYSLWGGGVRNFTIPWSTSLSAGNYWLAVLSRTTTGGGGGMSMSQICASQQASAFSGTLGAAPVTNQAPFPGWGVYSAQTAALPNAINVTQIQGTTSVQLRPPIIGFANGVF